MREDQINSLRQAEELFESAKTNVHLLEISKYLVKNMNAIQGAIERGWTIGADDNDTEYMKQYLELRDEYAPVLFSEYITVNGTYHPPASHETIIDAIKCGYDFNSECGKIIKAMIKVHYGITANEWHTKNYPEQAAFSREVLDILEEVSTD